MPSISLQSSDGENFCVDVEIARKSITIKTMLEDLGLEDEDAETSPVPLPNVDGKTLKKIIQWCTKHKDDEKIKIPDVGNLSLGSQPEVQQLTTGNAEKNEETFEEDGWTSDDLNLDKMEPWDIGKKKKMPLKNRIVSHHPVIFNFTKKIF